MCRQETSIRIVINGNSIDGLPVNIANGRALALIQPKVILVRREPDAGTGKTQINLR